MTLHIKEAMKQYLEGQRAYHVVNWETFTANPVGVAEHGDFMQTLEKELENIPFVISNTYLFLRSG